MKPVLVVCYSYTGVSERLARLLCSHTGWPLGFIAEERPRSGATGTLRCMGDALLRRKPAIRYQGPDPSGYRSVVLVSPVWMRRLCGPMRSFVAQHARSLRRVAVISTMNSGGAQNAVAEIAAMTAPAPCVNADNVIKAAFTSREIESDGFGSRLEDFARQLMPGSATPRRDPTPCRSAASGSSARNSL